jgi:hypothetical protein
MSNVKTPQGIGVFWHAFFWLFTIACLYGAWEFLSNTYCGLFSIIEVLYAN